MLFDLRSLLRSASPASATSSASSAYSTISPSSSSISANDRYPFPTNPVRVRKARHNNHPQYLPQPDASVRDVQYFLYTLLTSRKNDCAKKYPVWVLETCMSWTGDGEQLRTCTEEQLASLCPYTAVATGIDSPKHQLGEFVPIPGRFMIGQVIARFVLEKKGGETQPTEIQRRLDEEHKRASSAMGRYPSQKLLRRKYLSGTSTAGSRLSPRAHSSSLAAGDDTHSTNGLGPSTWIDSGATANNGHSTEAMTMPAHISGEPHMSGGRSGPIHASSMLSPVSSVASLVTQNTAGTGNSHPTANMVPNEPSIDYSQLEGMKDTNQARPQTSFIPLGAVASSMKLSDGQQLQPRQRRTGTHDGRSSPANSGRSSPANSGRSSPANSKSGEPSTINSTLPHRYAPRRSSTLRTSSTSENNSSSARSNIVTAQVFERDLIPTPANRRPVRRRSSLGGAKLIIPETLAEGSEKSDCEGEEYRKKMRHDSGVETSPYGDQSFSTSSPLLLNCTSPGLRDTAPSTIITSVDLPRPASVGPELHHARSSPLSYNTLPVAKQGIHSGVVSSRRSVIDLSITTGTPPRSPTNSPEMVSSRALRVVDHDSVRNITADRPVIMSNRFRAIEAEFYHMQEQHRMHQAREYNLPGQTLRKTQSDHTLYSSLDPMNELRGSRSHQWTQSPPPQTPPPQNPMRASRRPQSPIFPEKTLLDIIDDIRSGALPSSKAQGLARKKHENSKRT